MQRTISILSLAASAALLAACSSTGYQKADQTSTSLQQAAQSLDDSLVPFDAVLVALSDLVNNPAPDITPQFKKYSSAVTTLEAQANITRVHAAAMQEEGIAYFRNWSDKLATIENDDIRTRSLDRKIDVAAQFEEARSDYVQASAGFDPFLADLKDIRTALATDLTTGGLDSVSGLARNASRSGIPVREALVSVSQEFKKLGATLSSATPPL